jgi:hypothetical protein
MTKAVQAFIERQGVKVPVEIEPVLIGADPGLHVESVKPAVRVLMIDGVKSYVANLLTAQPVLRPESVYEFTERLINPAPVRKASPSAAPPQPEAAQVDPVVARAQAIFKASEEARPINPADFDFAMVDDDLAFAVSPTIPGPSVPGPVVAAAPAPKPARSPASQPLSHITSSQWLEQRFDPLFDHHYPCP